MQQRSLPLPMCALASARAGRRVGTDDMARAARAWQTRRLPLRAAGAREYKTARVLLDAGVLYGCCGLRLWYGRGASRYGW